MISLRFYTDLLKDRAVRCKYDWSSKNSGQGSAILMFHHIAETCPERVSESCFSSIRDFENLIDKLRRTKTFITIDQLCSELDAGTVPKDKIVITFDDVPADVYHNAIPILRQYGTPYTLYVATGLIGQSGYLSKEQIEELSKDPLCTIGSHTATHCKLKQTPNIVEELSASKTELERITGKAIRHFAYPYGTPFAISEKVIRQTEDSGLYRSAVCTIPAYINKYALKHRYSLPRIHSQLFIRKYFNSI